VTSCRPRSSGPYCLVVLQTPVGGGDGLVIFSFHSLYVECGRPEGQIIVNGNPADGLKFRMLPCEHLEIETTPSRFGVLITLFKPSGNYTYHRV
jgi:hypothetical protein